MELDLDAFNYSASDAKRNFTVLGSKKADKEYVRVINWIKDVSEHQRALTIDEWESVVSQQGLFREKTVFIPGLNGSETADVLNRLVQKGFKINITEDIVQIVWV